MTLRLIRRIKKCPGLQVLWGPTQDHLVSSAFPRSQNSQSQHSMLSFRSSVKEPDQKLQFCFPQKLYYCICLSLSLAMCAFCICDHNPPQTIVQQLLSVISELVPGLLQIPTFTHARFLYKMGKFLHLTYTHLPVSVYLVISRLLIMFNMM